GRATLGAPAVPRRIRGGDARLPPRGRDGPARPASRAGGARGGGARGAGGAPLLAARRQSRGAARDGRRAHAARGLRPASPSLGGAARRAGAGRRAAPGTQQSTSSISSGWFGTTQRNSNGSPSSAR